MVHAADRPGACKQALVLQLGQEKVEEMVKETHQTASHLFAQVVNAAEELPTEGLCHADSFMS